VGLNFKLDVGLYQLDQQVACQRYRQNFLIADRKSTIASLMDRFGDVKLPQLAPARVAAAA